MALTISLPADIEQNLRNRAAQRGQSLEAYLLLLAEQDFASGNQASASWPQMLALLQGLKRGWNGHDAPAPTAAAIANTEQFVAVLPGSGLEPTRLVASAVGGVAVTFRRGERKVMVEFLNDGNVHALFADDLGQVMNTKSVEPSLSAYQAFLADVRAYLNG